MRNTEQILKSVGLLAYEIGSLPECNEELSKYGPDNFNGDRITVKLRPGQQTAPGRNNISFASCSGQCTHKNNLYVSLIFLFLIAIFVNLDSCLLSPTAESQLCIYETVF